MILSLSRNLVRRLPALKQNALLNTTQFTRQNLLPISQKRFAHTQGDEELSQFVSKEILSEKQAQQTLPALQNWKIEQEGANVTLSRDFEDEQIVIRFNVNNSMQDELEDAEGVPAATEAATKDSSALTCRPAFEIEVKRKDATLAFNCSMTDAVLQPQPAAGGENSSEFVDLFDIDEFTIYSGSGDMPDDAYVLSGDVMDGEMYEHLMNLLDDRGIGPEFTMQLCQYATVYEHSQYVQLLEKLKTILTK